jgi:hypothetical protein
MNRPNRLLNALVFFACVTLSACGGGSSSSYSGTSAPAAVASTTTSSTTAASSTTVSAASVASAFTLSGVVTGDAAATVTTTGTATTTATTDSSGNFSFASLAAGSYTVTPSQSGRIFTPVSRAETITTESITDVVFDATASTAATYTISGTVTGTVMAGVTITLNGMNTGSAVTDLSGNYTFAGLVSGTYTVNASRSGYTFTAPHIVTVGTADSAGNNFTSSAQTSGGITFAATATLPQAVVGTPYSGSVVKTISGGTAPYHYQSGVLDDGTPPLGMIVNPNGDVTGTAAVAGVYDFTVCAVDATGEMSACEPTSLTVVAAPVVTATAPTPTPTPAPTVTISATPASTSAGGASTLNWSSTNATSCTASGGWTGTKATSGTASVSPTSSTTYTLSCAGTGGAAKSSVLVTVVPATPVAPTVTLSANTATITAGSTATLKWSSKNAQVCSGTGGWSGNQGTSGSTSVSPATTTTYGLSCTSSAGSAQASTKITVNAAVTAPTPAPTLTLTASPSTIISGNSSTLTWTSKNADSCTASNGWSGAQADSGNKSVSPTSNTTYTLSCSGAGGTAQESTTVTVTAATASAPPASGTSWVYYNGTFDWPGDYSFVATPDYSDTSGGPLSGAHDIKITSAPYGGWLPYAQNWDFNSAPYTKLTFSLKPTHSGQAWQVYFVKVGDIPVGISVNVSNYGPAPVAGQWATYTIPLRDLGVLGQPIYKFAIQDQSGVSGNVWYVDNVGFVP